VLTDQSKIDSVIHETKVANLSVMTCGTIPPNPAEMLGSEKMKSLLSELKKKFDIVIIDSPPVIAVTDPVVLSPEVDGVVMVIKSGSTSGDAAVRSKSLLESANARILGAVLNGVKIGDLHGRYGRYYHQQCSSYYTDEGEKKGRKRDA
jgi:capsular exopolysaccharide synthesis family protein